MKTDMDWKFVDRGAQFSYGRRYRYRLWREWRGFGRKNTWRWLGTKDGAGNELGQPLSCVFVMLNPSTADENTDDPTIRRCIGYAQSWGYDRLEVVNLFAYCATNPSQMLALNHDEDPVGPNNMEHIRKAVADAGIIICAWGANGTHLDQDETVLGWIDRPVHALELTSTGIPKHPLYLKSSLKPIKYEGRK